MSNSLNDFLKNMDSKTLAEAVKAAQEYAKTEEGKKTIESLKRGDKIGGKDKNEIMSLLKGNPELVKKLNELL